MNYYPLIYSDRKQVAYDYDLSASETISLSASISAAGYEWTFYPDLAISVTGSTTDQSISCRLEGDYYSAIHAVWSDPTDNNAPKDDIEILIYNPEVLELSESPRAYYEDLYLPISLQQTFVGINEITTCDTINNTIRSLYDNFSYIINKSKYIDMPLSVVGFRYGSSTSPETSNLGLQWQQVSREHEVSAYHYWGYTTPFSADLIAGNSKYTLYVTNNTTLNVMSNTNGPVPIAASREFPVFASDGFEDIKSVVFEESDIIWVLEYSGRISKLKYDGKWTYISSLSDSIVSATNMVVSDSKLYVVSKNTVNGLDQINIFDYAINSLGATYDEKVPSIVGLATTRDYIIALDTSNNMHFFDKFDLELKRTNSASEYLSKYSPVSESLESSSITNIYNAQDDYYYFATTENLIYKFSQDGGLIGFGGVDAVSSAYAVDTIEDYTLIGLTQDINNNLYVLSNYDILKYYEVSIYDNITLRDSAYTPVSSYWALSALEIKSEEYCSYWVYNRVFNRMYDNFVLYLNVLTGKLYNTGTNIISRGFFINELPILPYTKDEIYIGINELHSEAAVNRNIRKLYACLESLLEGLELKASDEQYQITWNGSYLFNGSIVFGG